MVTQPTPPQPAGFQAARAYPGRPAAGTATPGDSDSVGYNGFHKTLHWTTVLLAVLQLLTGFLLASDVDLPEGAWKMSVTFHKSTGLVILALTALRLVWRGTHRVPPPSAGLRPWERLLSLWVHWLLYVMLFVQPTVGWMLHSAQPDQTRFYGLFPLPKLPFVQALGEPQAVLPALTALHETGAFVILALVGLHVAGAVKHHFLNRDDVLLRMAPEATFPFLERLRGQR